jgi:hypothetical protein
VLFRSFFIWALLFVPNSCKQDSHMVKCPKKNYAEQDSWENCEEVHVSNSSSTESLVSEFWVNLWFLSEENMGEKAYIIEYLNVDAPCNFAEAKSVVHMFSLLRKSLSTHCH